MPKGKLREGGGVVVVVDVVAVFAVVGLLGSGVVATVGLKAQLAAISKLVLHLSTLKMCILKVKEGKKERGRRKEGKYTMAIHQTAILS